VLLIANEHLQIVPRNIRFEVTGHVDDCFGCFPLGLRQFGKDDTVLVAECDTVLYDIEVKPRHKSNAFPPPEP